MGDGVGRADLDRDAVDALDGVARAGGLDLARGCVGRGRAGDSLRLGRTALGRVERIEAEADAIQGEQNQGGERQEGQNGEDATEGRGEVQGPGKGLHQRNPRLARQARTSKQGQAFSHSFDVILPSPFLSGDRSR